MAAMAAGDAAFIFTLLEHFGGHLAGAVRRIVGEMGRTDVLTDPAEIDGLVQDAAFFLYDHAAAWQPEGGALPWVWAERGIRNLVASAVGHRVVAEPDDLEAEVTTAPGCGGDLGPDDLIRLLRDWPELVLLFEALDGVCNERNAHVFLEYRIQQRLGDQSPAATVGAMFDLSPANVRQIHHRVRNRLAPVLADDRYRPLADLPLLVA
jgi:DNA-directed RNA polymerase specialized sigma24 family protein